MWRAKPKTDRLDASNPDLAEQRSAANSAVGYWRDRPPSPDEVAAMNIRATRAESLTIDLPSGAAEAIAVLQEALARVPEAYRGEAELDLESDYENSDVRVSINFLRLETDAEWSARRKDVDRRQVLAMEHKAATERAEYERLKAKFEGGA